ncbi:MAG: lactate utilization protein [Planctomycetota bacterium]|nr:lactate utilization protein [Planctomycetota bacterium]
MADFKRTIDKNSIVGGHLYMKEKLEKVAEALRKNNFDVHIVASGDEARKLALSLIPEGASVGLGGSVTVQQVGLLDALRNGKYRLFDQYEAGISREENIRRRKQGLTADFFVTGTNAVTEDGELVNIDGFGNRVAALAFGPSKVILLVGRNKLVKNIEAGFKRIYDVVAPKNAKRFGVNPPCVKDGKCSNCNHPQRICNIYSVIARQVEKGRITVILIDSDLGF